jgi:hypothetical protein
MSTHASPFCGIKQTVMQVAIVKLVGLFTMRSASHVKLVAMAAKAVA